MTKDETPRCPVCGSTEVFVVLTETTSYYHRPGSTQPHHEGETETPADGGWAECAACDWQTRDVPDSWWPA